MPEKKVACGSFSLRGCNYRVTQAEVDRLKRGDAIILEREPTNEFDVNAIKCIIEGMHYGYMPKELAQHFSPMMENGLRLTAVVLRTDVKFTVKAGLFMVTNDGE